MLWLGSLAAAAQQQVPTQPPPAATQPPAAEAPAKAPPAQNEPPTAPAVKPSEAPATAGTQNLIGLHVFSSDGTRVGEVKDVSTGPGGDVVALRIRTGGFLGFGGRIVAIPGGRFSRSGQIIRLDLDADQVSGLPSVGK
jgi:sporulation protein YlmC with PRC-barrel domain